MNSKDVFGLEYTYREYLTDKYQSDKRNVPVCSEKVHNIVSPNIVTGFNAELKSSNHVIAKQINVKPALPIDITLVEDLRLGLDIQYIASQQNKVL